MLRQVTAALAAVITLASVASGHKHACPSYPLVACHEYTRHGRLHASCRGTITVDGMIVHLHGSSSRKSGNR